MDKEEHRKYIVIIYSNNKNNTVCVCVYREIEKR